MTVPNPGVHHADAAIGARLAFEADFNGRTRHGIITGFTPTGYLVDLVGIHPQTIEVDADDESIRITPASPAAPTIHSETTRFVVSEVRGHTRTLRDWESFTRPSVALQTADEYNQEEQELAALERRPIRRRFEVVRAVTTYEAYVPESTVRS